MTRLTTALALTSVFIIGCGSDVSPPGDPAIDDPFLAAPPPGQGVQYQMVGSIPAGSEVEQCKFVQAPSNGLWVNRDEVRFDEGSHHFILFETTYDQIPTQKDDGTPVDTSDIFDCSDGPTNEWSITRLVGGSQNFNGDPAVSFPSDVALRVRPNAVLMMNAHYLNTTAETLTPEVRINLWTLPEENVSEEGDILFWYDIFIHSPAMQKASARMRCKVPEDITLLNAQSHMHARGIGFEAAVMGDDMPFYFNDKWEDVPVVDYGSGMAISAGSVIEYGCDYENNAAQDVFQGPKSTDEMCMLIGSYYPTVPGLSFCASDPERPALTNALGAEWIGQGQKTCGETVACVQEASEDEFFTHLQRCVADSDPAVSAYVSDAVRCLLMSFIDGEEPTAACSEEFVSCLGN